VIVYVIFVSPPPAPPRVFCLLLRLLLFQQHNSTLGGITCHTAGIHVTDHTYSELPMHFRLNKCYKLSHQLSCWLCITTEACVEPDTCHSFFDHCNVLQRDFYSIVHTVFLCSFIASIWCGKIIPRTVKSLIRCAHCYWSPFQCVTLVKNSQPVGPGVALC
jgi:hypothetical protein